MFFGKIFKKSLCLSALLFFARAAPAVTYFSETQVAEVLFPGIALKQVAIELNSLEVKAIQKASRERVLDPKLRIWAGPGGTALFIDRVVGKHDFITYAVAISSTGQVQGLEIMEYRETYGHQVRNASWRQEFVGKDKTALLKVGKDIDAISGATLSAVHVTAGIRRMIQTYEVTRQRLKEIAP
jgi:hypothetical protein